MLTVLDVVTKTAEFLATKGVESPRLNAELLIGHALGLPRMQLYVQFERTLSEGELEKIRALVRRRGQREPLQYIVGTVDFCGLHLKVDPRALIPRPETELLVEAVITHFRNLQVPKRLLDLGTGTGAIALALAKHWPEAEVVAVDSCDDALALARENALALGMAERVSLLRSDWFQGLPPGMPFDLIVANPPYLSEAEVAEATPEVREHEPKAALGSPKEGLADLERILSSGRSFLSPGGLLALETGIEQHAALTLFAGQSGWDRVRSLKDLTKRDRFLLLTRS